MMSDSRLVELAKFTSAHIDKAQAENDLKSSREMIELQDVVIAELKKRATLTPYEEVKEDKKLFRLTEGNSMTIAELIAQQKRKK